jgi:hypothetical protein
MLEFYNLHNVCSKSWVSSVESKLLAIEIDKWRISVNNETSQTGKGRN